MPKMKLEGKQFPKLYSNTENFYDNGKNYIAKDLIGLPVKIVYTGNNGKTETDFDTFRYDATFSDNGHGGLVCVSVYYDGVTISGIVNLNGWSCTRMQGENSVTLKNVVASNMDVYIMSIGEGNYR